MRYLLILSLSLGFVFSENDDNDEDDSKLRNFESSLEEQDENKNSNTSSSSNKCDNDDEHPIITVFKIFGGLGDIFDRDNDGERKKSTSYSRSRKRNSEYHEKFEREPQISYQQYPFAESVGGIFGQKYGKSTIIIPRISTHLVANDLTGTQYGVDFFHRKYGFSFNYLQFSEDINPSAEYLSFTDINYNFHFTNYYRNPNTKHDWQGQIGIKSMHGNNDYYGLNFGIKYLYFTYPVHFGFSMGYSRLNEGNIFEFNPEISYHFERLEFTLGYSFIRTETEHLGGAKLSIGLWF